VAVCGVSLEASTFSPALTTAAMLAPRRGREVLDAWDFWSEGGSLADRAAWIGVLQARSIAGGARGPMFTNRWSSDGDVTPFVGRVRRATGASSSRSTPAEFVIQRRFLFGPFQLVSRSDVSPHLMRSRRSDGFSFR